MIDHAVQQSRSATELERFLRLVAAEPALADEFWDIADQQRFIEHVVGRGEKLGYWFAAEHVEAALRAGWQSWLERAIP